MIISGNIWDAGNPSLIVGLCKASAVSAFIFTQALTSSVLFQDTESTVI